MRFNRPDYGAPPKKKRLKWLLLAGGVLLILFLSWRTFRHPAQEGLDGPWPVERVVETVREKKIPLVGLSALMTTTLQSMEETIAALHAANLDCKVMVGGAVLTESYAMQIGADWYARDAKQSADIARAFFGVQ